MKQAVFVSFLLTLVFYVNGQSGPLPPSQNLGVQETSIASHWVYSIYPAAYQLSFNDYNLQTGEWGRIDSTWFSYNAQNILQSYSIFEKNGVFASYNPRDRHTFTYASNDSIVMEETESYSNGTWQPNARHIYSYNNQQKLDTMTTLLYGSGQWNLHYRITWLYDASGYDSIVTNYTDESGVLVPTSQSRSTINAQGQEILNNFFSRVNNQWVLVGRSELRYDSQGHLLDRLSLKLDTLTMVWDSTRRDLRGYNGQGNLITFFQLVDDPNATSLVKEYALDFSYLSTGKVDQVLQSYYDPDQMAYTFFELDTTLYYGLDSAVTYTFNWYDTSTTRKKRLYHLLEFDNQQRLIRELFQSWKPAQNGFRPGYEGQIIYLDQLLGWDQPKLNALHIFPNPANRSLRISLPALIKDPSSLQIYDISGRVVHKQIVQEGTKEININGLNQWSKGTYLIELRWGPDHFVSEFQVH